MNLSILLAQTAGDPAGCANAMMLPLMLVLFFYFLVWRPQQKQMNEAKRFRDGLASGDRVVTAGGLFGKIQEVDGEVVTLEIASSVRVRVLRSQIAQNQPDREDGEASSETSASESKRQERRNKS